MEVEEKESGSGFNKRRAEGRDKIDLPKKNLQLKVCKLNPINTISFVQILGTGMDTQDTSPAVMLFFDKDLYLVLGRLRVGFQVNVWGPSDLKYLVDAMRSFIPNAAMVHTKSVGPIFGTDESSVQCQSNPIVLLDDEVVKISAVILQPNRFEVRLKGANEIAGPLILLHVYVQCYNSRSGPFGNEVSRVLGWW